MAAAIIVAGIIGARVLHDTMCGDTGPQFRQMESDPMARYLPAGASLDSQQVKKVDCGLDGLGDSNGSEDRAAPWIDRRLTLSPGSDPETAKLQALEYARSQGREGPENRDELRHTVNGQFMRLNIDVGPNAIEIRLTGW